MDTKFITSRDKPSDAFINVAPFYDELMEDVPYENWVDYIEHLFKKNHVSPKSILDIGCGTGAITILMSQRYYHCVGIDISEPMLAQARRAAIESGLDIEFHCQDATELSLPGKNFDAIVSVFDSLNYITEYENLISSFVQARKHLSKTGIFIFDLNSEYAFQANLFNQASIFDDESLHYVWKSTYDEESRICTVDMVFRKYSEEDKQENIFRERHYQRAYSIEEVTEGLKKAGFEKIFCYDAYSFRAPKKKSDRIYFVAL
jgi:ubiquinone/menaquinone biosynthesis C-methylase UbiE